MKKGLIYAGCLLLMLTGAGCKSRPGTDTRDTPEQGTINISVDESFKPVIEEQLRVHHASFPNTKINVSYKPEAACFRDLQSDSTRMIIVARGLTEKEQAYYGDKLSFRPQFAPLAYDAIAVIINRASEDSVFTMARLKDILSGKEKLTAVMDGENATSTVRFLQDSILKGASFGANVVAAQGSQAVIDLVSKRSDVVGFVGQSWVGDGYDPKQVEYLKTIRLGLVECVLCKERDLFTKPSQASITHGEYPLARPLYYILKENAAGLGTGFMNFMSMERGQLIFRRAFLAPAKMGFDQRRGMIKESD